LLTITCNAIPVSIPKLTHSGMGKPADLPAQALAVIPDRQKTGIFCGLIPVCLFFEHRQKPECRRALACLVRVSIPTLTHIRMG
jgi:hypothetical protein